MTDILISFFRSTLPDELANLLQPTLQSLQKGDFLAILQRPEVRVLLGLEETEITKDVQLDGFPIWSDYIFHRLGVLLAKRSDDSELKPEETPTYLQHLYFIAAVAALYAFLQSTATGPPLPFVSAETLFPSNVSSNKSKLANLRQQLVASLSTDGVAAYKLTPNVELLSLAETILICPPIQKNVTASTWARLRARFIHQRLLSEVASSIQATIYEDLDALSALILGAEQPHVVPDLRVHFLLERAAINTHHGFDKKARADLDQATSERKFEFALTGLMGKRTKYQQKDTSQLLVLAKSADSTANGTSDPISKPTNLDLNDDTLLESISFTEGASSTDIKSDSNLPASLSSLDPADQPLLDPLDSIILLSLASSITNTNPADGLTREETIPYATRVLEGGSSNWQVYTQALLVRSRIEGYKTRTMERGLLQLQALVDQVIADTGSVESNITTESSDAPATSFLPKAKEGESAPVSDRLTYFFSLASPSRWDLEAELASRWVHVGGLRSALEIYERLEMWAEAALCWAATEKEDKARRMIRRQLFHATNGDDDSIVDLDAEKWEGPPRNPPPIEAPRFYSILGDIDRDISMYEKAWEVSGSRYARAQRSLGRHYITDRNYASAAESYSLALKINSLNQPSWFALGCCHLELQQFKKAVEAFSRCVQLDDQDAEAWSNLAAALLYLRPKVKPENTEEVEGIEGEEERTITTHPRHDALKAFKRAAALKHDNVRIWSNVLSVAGSTNPPSYQDIVTSQRRIIELRGSSEGEKCIDADILDLLVKHTVQLSAEDPEFSLTRPGLPRLVNELIETSIKPLITASAPLWTTLATFYTHTSRPSSALSAHEKAWRVVFSQPNWENGSEERWNEVVERTIELVDAYESFGPRERLEGLGAGSGELVARDWRFKGRSAMRSVMGRGKEGWEGSVGWEKLGERMEGLKGGN
ncbi:hypothetical protein B0J11DRAFT_613479 [Dendryphion nanum]|uniref:TPR-like protein n=1 Tax=Dendryphion nanum TaxID=256645 RepID=A0A9P9IR64_9PLEO|nr:hypothetical protein B0J11DRAFT_613479 [Dendryphion nanum]